MLLKSFLYIFRFTNIKLVIFIGINDINKMQTNIFMNVFCSNLPIAIGMS
jgi:hypothetical protein